MVAHPPGQKPRSVTEGAPDRRDGRPCRNASRRSCRPGMWTAANLPAHPRGLRRAQTRSTSAVRKYGTSFALHNNAHPGGRVSSNAGSTPCFLRPVRPVLTPASATDRRSALLGTGHGGWDGVPNVRAAPPDVARAAPVPSAAKQHQSSARAADGRWNRRPSPIQGHAAWLRFGRPLKVPSGDPQRDPGYRLVRQNARSGPAATL